MAIFQMDLGITVSSFWIALQIRMMEMVVTTGAIRCAKLQSNRHQQTNAQLFTGRMPFLLPNHVKADKGNQIEMH